MIRATCDFQSRIYNIVQLNFLKSFCNRSEKNKDYAINNTLFVVAEYLGWVEIIRKEIQFLDLGKTDLTKKFNDHIETITHILLTSRYHRTFNCFRGEQRAIGEIMIENSDNGLVCIGYATFKLKLKDPEFKAWFNTLIESTEELSIDHSYSYFQRLIILQHALIDLIDFLDSDKIRISEKRRSKIKKKMSQPALNPQ